VQKRKQAQDIMVTGSASVVRTLMAHDLIDEYRLLVFPPVLGAGTRLFPDGIAPVNLALASAQTAGPAVRLLYTRLASPRTYGQCRRRARRWPRRPTVQPMTTRAIVSPSDGIRAATLTKLS
jgi:RibD C-terminal domain